MKQSTKFKPKPNCSFLIAQLKSFQPWGFTSFEKSLITLYCVFLDKTKLPQKIGQGWRALRIRATIFQSRNVPYSVRMLSTVHQCMNNESLWWMLMDFMRFMAFVLRESFSGVQLCTYNVTQKGRKTYSLGRGLCLLMGLCTAVYRGTCSINCLFMPPWNRRISTTRSWEGKAQQGFLKRQSVFFSFTVLSWPCMIWEKRNISIWTAGFHHAIVRSLLGPGSARIHKHKLFF